MTLVRSRFGAILAVLALAVGAGACGSDDSDGGNGSEGSQSAQAAEEIDTSTPDGQVRAVIVQFTEGLQNGEAAKACGLVTAKVEKQLIGFFKGAKSCEDVVRMAAPKLKKGDPTILSVKVNGARAKAEVKSVAGDRIQTLDFVEQGGAWKISDGFDEAPRKVKKS